VDLRVLEAMLPELTLIPANPSSVHFFGQEAKQRLNKARQTIAEYFHVKPSEIIFTSGGTEGINMLLKGAASPPCHIITSNIEHSAVFQTVQWLEKKGCQITYLDAGLYGAVDPEAILASIKKETRMIVLTAVNSETGVKTDIEAIAKIAKDASIPFFVDAVALLGKEIFPIPQGVTGMAFSAHKFHGPKGIGFCYIRSSVKLQPLIHGGEQEYGKRSGTENLPGIIGLQKAVELLKDELPEASNLMRSLRDRLEIGLKNRLEKVIVNGDGPRIVNTLNMSFLDVQGEDLLMQLDLNGIAVSHGSACSSGAVEPSRILLNMGIPKEIAKSAVRFSLCRFTTEEEIDRCIEITANLVTRLRQY
jgi:cysteine desulfurase